ncbi:MAG: response regulator [Deltaproteobacteria bacterium]|nr:response regulator [Candidatus Anaeroferrophillus wilburensis]MBN2889765.1 response regulator [Deltaproteobacteria bacterium]
MAFNLLVVDDSVSMRQIIKRVISLSGFDVGTVFEAGNGKEALAVLDDHWVDIIVTDIHMPEMNGIALLEQVKSDQLLQAIPVVMVTTEAREQIVDRATELGASGYLKKPFHPEEIKQLLLSVLGVENVDVSNAESDECDF